MKNLFQFTALIFLAFVFVPDAIAEADDSETDGSTFIMVLEDGTEILLDDTQSLEDQSLENELAQNPQLANFLNNKILENSTAIEEEDLLSEDWEAVAAVKKSKRKKKRYSNRGILGPKGAWPVGQGKCTTLKGKASYYGAGEKLKRHTASGHVFKSNAIAAAHRTLPLGSRVTIINVKNGKKVSNVVINDRGPAIETGREIDVTRATAEKLNFIRAGHTNVQIRVCRG